MRQPRLHYWAGPTKEEFVARGETIPPALERKSAQLPATPEESRLTVLRSGLS
jgi:hypothetical protein